MSPPLLTVEGVSKTFRRGRDAGHVTALADIDLTVADGETLGLVGGSGAGKSTLARLIAGLDEPDTGRITIDAQDLSGLGRREQRRVRRAVHLLFQDPYTALPPHLRIGQAVAEPLVIHHERHVAERVRSALVAVGLTPPERYAARYPHQLSGGEQQRAALARGLVLRPRLLLADEPTAMLDAHVRQQLLGLMGQLRAKHRIAYLFITHDLAQAAGFCDRLVVLQAGRVVEEGPSGRLISDPQHPYTAALVAAARRLQPPPSASTGA